MRGTHLLHEIGDKRGVRVSTTRVACRRDERAVKKHGCSAERQALAAGRVLV